MSNNNESDLTDPTKGQFTSQNFFGPSFSELSSGLSLGLSYRSLNILKEILLLYIGEIGIGKIEKINVFGSRAMGNYEKNSDLDIVVYGSISSKAVDRLFTLFEESSLAIKVDVIKYETITNPELKEHIDREGKTFFLSASNE